MRIHERGRLIDGIINKEIDGRINFIPNQNMLGEKQLNINANNAAKLIPGKIENKHFEKTIIDKNIRNLNDDINMKDATKMEKYKK